MKSNQSRLSRLLGILLMLRSKEWVSAQEIADRFVVSLRTVYRDIETLQKNDVSIRGVPGPDGGYRLATEAPFDVFKFADNDAWSLFLFGGAGPEIPDSFRSTLEGAQQRIQDIVRPEDAQLLKLIQQRVFFDTSDWYWKNESLTLIPGLREAITTQQVVSLTHRPRGSNEPTDSELEAYGLVWKSGEWYLVGKPPSGGEVTRIRVSRIIRYSLKKNTFSYPQNFNLAQWWTKDLESFGVGNVRTRLVVNADARSELLTLRTKNNSEIEEMAGGMVRLTLYVDHWNWLIPLVMSYGNSVYVEEPAELREAVVNALERTLLHYCESSTDYDSSFVNDDSRQRATKGRH